jgi:four helix bundle protein
VFDCARWYSGLQILKSHRLYERALSASICTNSPELGAFASGAGVAPWLGVNPKAKALQERTHQFSVRVIALCEALPRTDAARSIALQLLDSSGSTDSNYRGACRARSRKEFIAKLGVAAEEADESLGWLRKLVDRGIGPRDEVSALAQERTNSSRSWSDHRTRPRGISSAIESTARNAGGIRDPETGEAADSGRDAQSAIHDPQHRRAA